MCTKNVLPRYCKSHDPSRAMRVEGSTVVGLSFRRRFVNANWTYENLMIELMPVTKIFKTCYVWLIEILHWLYLPWKFKQFIELGLCLWEMGDTIQQSSCCYVCVFICDKTSNKIYFGNIFIYEINDNKYFTIAWIQ